MGMKGTGVELINKGTIVASGNGSYTPSETPYDYDGTYIDGGIGILGYNSQISNSGRIETSGTNGVGILGNNGSKVTNEESGTIVGTGKGEILADENGIVLAGTIGSVGIKVNNNSEAINYGKIEMAGARTRGMQAYNQSKIVNEGTINLNSESQYISEWYEDDGEMEYDKGLIFTREIGIEARNESKAYNNGEINAYGTARGMEARNESKAYNNGDIYIEGKIEETQEDILSGWEGYDTNYVISNSRGMDIRDSSYGENNGSISLIGGFGTGILARDTSEAINKGDIYLESSSQLVKELCEHDDPNENHIDEYLRYTRMRGIEARDYSKVFNEKNIEILGSGTGIRAYENSYGENSESGNIYMESIPFIQEYIWTDQDGNIIKEKEIELTYIEGMAGVNNSEIVNKGNIVLAGLGNGMY
ncbi:MAG: hypothetical protein ACRC5T_08605, partial [Cetobacterium sp.]